MTRGAGGGHGGVEEEDRSHRVLTENPPFSIRRVDGNEELYVGDIKSFIHDVSTRTLI